ncbi:helix-turn-helix domain-containing protein [Streptomyces atratus]|uniref:helix-turn-helix domain-containing protein n=1 Tax=Streptomyces atratus TaxID=1893 RepID=UPI0038D03598
MTRTGRRRWTRRPRRNSPLSAAGVGRSHPRPCRLPGQRLHPLREGLPRGHAANRARRRYRQGRYRPHGPVLRLTPCRALLFVSFVVLIKKTTSCRDSARPALERQLLLPFLGRERWNGGMDEQSPIAATLAQVGSRLRRIRAQRGVSLSALAEATGISKSTLSRLESGAAPPEPGAVAAHRAGPPGTPGRTRRGAGRSATRGSAASPASTTAVR